MLNDILHKRIIELAGKYPRLGRLPPLTPAPPRIPSCAVDVKIGLKMDGPVVTDLP